MISVEGASFAYDGGPPLFRDISFSLAPGETLAVLGANGIGKTTLLRCMMNFLRLKQGTVRLEGRDVSSIPVTEFWKTVSYVPQAKQAVFGYSVINMVVMGRSQYVPFASVPQKRDYEQAMDVLDDLNIADLAMRSCGTLSGGQLQLVLIARALSKEPKVLIMDEPESNLDLKNQLKVLDIIDYLSHEKGLSILINTHFPGNAIRCADKTLLMKKDGHLFGPAREIITRENMQAYFDISAELVDVQAGGRQYSGLIPIRILDSAAAADQAAAPALRRTGAALNG